MVRNNRRTCNGRERTVRKYSECNATQWFRANNNQIRMAEEFCGSWVDQPVCGRYIDCQVNDQF